MTLAVGTRFGTVPKLSPRSRRSMGEVYRARDLRLGRDVAIKGLSASFARDAERFGKVRAGSAVPAAALSHPNILAVYDVGANAGAPYLRHRAARRRRRFAAAWPPGHWAVRKIHRLRAADRARARCGAHDTGIVHRDLKPENLFVTA